MPGDARKTEFADEVELLIGRQPRALEGRIHGVEGIGELRAAGGSSASAAPESSVIASNGRTEFM